MRTPKHLKLQRGTIYAHNYTKQKQILMTNQARFDRQKLQGVQFMRG